MARRSYEQRRLGNALTWALRCQDQDFISFLVDELLQDFLDSGQLQCLDLLEHLGSPAVLNDRLTFLVKYCELRRIFMEGKNADAAALLVDLLDARLAPKFFWSRLMTDALPLLRCVVLEVDQTFTLLRVLGEMDCQQDKLRDVRAALNRNLGKAHMLQFSAKDDTDNIYI